MNVNTRHNPQANRRQRRTLRWEIRSTAIEQHGRSDPALDGSASSYGCDGCPAPMQVASRGKGRKARR